MQNFNPSNGGDQTTTGRKGPNPLTEDNMDDYLERLLQKERDRNQHANQEFFDNNQALKHLRELEEE